jgi:hypothetical protein
VAESLLEHLLGLPRAVAVGWFVNAWHGIPTLSPVADTAQIPSLLGQLLALGRTHPAICSRQNRLIDPVEVDYGLLCFYVENQSVYRWAYQPGEPDPVVVGRYLDEDGWVAEQQRLSGFLLQVCLFEAVFSAPYSASAAWLPPEELAAVLTLGGLRPLLTPWRWPEHPTLFHAADDAIATGGLAPTSWSPPDGWSRLPICRTASASMPIAGSMHGSAASFGSKQSPTPGLRSFC